MLGTSALPGATGMVGYSVLKPCLGPTLPASTVPSPDQVLSLITWKGDDAPSPRAWQDVPTIFERLPAGSAVSIGPARFAGSGLTEAALRGASHLGADRLEDRPGLAAGALRRGTPLVYLYVGELDKTGHKHGWLSEQWLAQLERLDSAMAELVRRVPAGTRIILSRHRRRPPHRPERPRRARPRRRRRGRGTPPDPPARRRRRHGPGR